MTFQDSQGINKILQILRRDAKVATYKFALLRGVVEVLEQAPFRAPNQSLAPGTFPLGLLVERWIYYYFPLVQAGYRQATSSAGIAFGKPLRAALARYPTRGGAGLSAFHQDYRRGRIRGEEAALWAQAGVVIARTMTNMPMKHLGFSAEKRHYAVVNPERRSFRQLPCPVFDAQFLLESFGAYSVGKDYLEPIRMLNKAASRQSFQPRPNGTFPPDLRRRLLTAFLA